MDSATLDALGLDRESIENKVVDQVCHSLLYATSCDDKGHGYSRESEWQLELQKKIEQSIDARLEKIAKDHVEPNVKEKIDSLVLQQTNEWGEKKGKPVTFVEYVTGKAEEWLEQKVDYRGVPSRSKSDGSRLIHMIDEHLGSRIKTGIQDIAKQANEQLGGEIKKVVSAKLAEMTKRLKVSI